MFNAGVENEVLGSAAVDALTITAHTAVGRAAQVATFEELAARSQEGVETWRGIGYTGYKVGDVIYGSRPSESILIAKGGGAEDVYTALSEAAPLEDVRVTRIDLCVDFVFDRPWSSYLAEMRVQDAIESNARRAGRELKLVSSLTGDTLYFGRRTSQRFGRIYDKSDYYDLPLGSVYRYEIETKRQVARAVVKTIWPKQEDIGRSWKTVRPEIRRIIRAQFLKWGVNVEWDNVGTTVVRAEARVSTVDRQLEWLSRVVAPTVRKLRIGGYEQRAFEALGLVGKASEGEAGAMVELNGGRVDRR